ncbi:MAG: enoyl-CoA hydratase/isomerase family protein [Sphingomonadales bacterium]|nr:MAG: enoyl-CoA hydratase/isomerase family protein [Sphingomonadales bacterium]
MLTGRDVLLVEKRGHILLLTLNREERGNALSRELRERLDEEIRSFDEDDDLWVLVLTGRGGKFFSTGMDLKEFDEQRGASAAPIPKAAGKSGHNFITTWKPMIAAINGHACAGGWAIAQRCDLRLAADTATLAITESRWNLAAPFAGEPHLFPTKAIAAEIALMARPITAQRAYEIGFVNKVVPGDELLAEALEWAAHLCTLGQEAIRGHKKLFYYSQWAPPSEIPELSRDIFYWTLGGKPGVVVDPTVGARAFAEGRQPDFGDMFAPRRLRCPVCAAEYAVVRNGDQPIAIRCHGNELVDCVAD